MSKDLYKPVVYGVGYRGSGSYKPTLGGKHTKEYASWKRMLSRCYSEKQLERFPTYIGCFVTKEWHNFQNFAKWYEQNHIENFQLDKDILIKGNKIYSPETCCFVPNEINSYFINCKSARGELPIGVTLSKNGKRYVVKIRKNNTRKYIGVFDTREEAFEVFKYEKEKYAIELANKYKTQITEKCYNALINYKIEIND